MCLVFGFIIIGGWIWAVVGLANGIIWIYGRGQKNTAFGYLSLLFSVGLTAAFSISGGYVIIAMVATIFGLAAWDLRYLDQISKDNIMEAQTRQFQLNHLKSLGMVLVTSIFVIVVGSTIRLDLPFIILFILFAIVFFVLNKTWNSISKI